jgi:AraC-like DNA-binding protein
MQYKITKPSPQLTPFIKQYWSMNLQMKECEKHAHRIVPSGLFELIFYFNDIPETSDKTKNITSNINITGQLNGFHDIIVKGNISLFSVYFQPYGLSLMLNIPLREIFNHSVPLADLLKGKVAGLEDKMYEASDHNACVQVIEAYIWNLIRENSKNYHQQRIKHVVENISKWGVQTDIDSLASDAFLSRRQFDRSFANIIGTSPKQFIRIVRFQKAIHLKAQNSGNSLTEIAAHAGYFDQAHMINEFKLLSGYTPSEFFSNCDAYSDYFGK